MFRSRFGTRLLVVLPLLGIATARCALAQCDSTYVKVGGLPLATGAAAAFEQVFADSLSRFYPPDSVSWDHGSGYIRVSLPERRFEIAVHSTQSFGFGGSGRETYRVVGPPAGTPVSIGVRLVGVAEIVFYQYCGGSGCNPVAGITVDGVATEHLEAIVIGSFRDVVQPFDRSIVLTRPAGEPFTLKYGWSAGTSHSPAYVSILGRVEFTGLPPGASVVSCLEEIVPTVSRPASWGGIKARYRRDRSPAP